MTHLPPSQSGDVYEQEATFRSNDDPETANVIGKVESHGIDVIPLGERRGTPSALFPFWLGSNLIFTYLLFGGILFTLGLSLATTIAVAVIANLTWVFVGIVSIAGPRSGTAALVISRAQYGLHGNRINCFFNWLVLVGYEGVDFAIAAFACYSLAGFAGWHLNTFWKAVLLGAIIFISFAVGLYGHATIFLFQKICAWSLGIAAILFAIFLIPHVNFSYHPKTPLHGSALAAALMVAVSVVLSGTLSYPNGPDYSRYLPAKTSPRRVVLFTMFGGLIPAVTLTVIGILAATAVNPTDFTSSIQAVVPNWFYPIFLLVVIFGMIANAILSIYSGGLSLQSLGVPLARSKTVWIDAVVGTALAVYGVLVSGSFLAKLENFLLWSVYWFAPFFGIYLVELILTRGYYDGHELHRARGRYWYKAGFRWQGLVALAAGMAFSALTSNTPYLKGPLSTGLLNGGDLSAVGGLVVGGLVYFVLCVLPPSVRRAAVGAARMQRDEPRVDEILVGQGVHVERG